MISPHEVEQMVKEMEADMELHKAIDIVELSLFLIYALEKEGISIDSRSKMMWVLFFLHCKYMDHMKQPIPLLRDIQVGRIEFYSKVIFDNFTEPMFYLVTPGTTKVMKSLRALEETIHILKDISRSYLEDDKEKKMESQLEIKKVSLEQLLEWAKELLSAPDNVFDRREILMYHDYFKGKLEKQEKTELDDKELFEEIQNNPLFFDFKTVAHLQKLDIVIKQFALEEG